jgi:hypothetical protein
VLGHAVVSSGVFVARFRSHLAETGETGNRPNAADSAGKSADRPKRASARFSLRSSARRGRLICRLHDDNRVSEPDESATSVGGGLRANPLRNRRLWRRGLSCVEDLVGAAGAAADNADVENDSKEAERDAQAWPSGSGLREIAS